MQERITRPPAKTGKLRTGEKGRVPGGVAIAALAVLLLAVIIASFLLGRYPVPPKELFGILLSKIFPITQFWTDNMEAAVWNIRLPRIILAGLVGICLCAAGGAYQGVFQNPMASPDILGASAGAGFGAALALYAGLPSLAVTFSAFTMSLLTVALKFRV
ncbi:MAG TPA: hypothetical protein DD735_11335, partial [Clostridiales bacterium]|nr:hypothetical protein [Clostridiales bacterium]